MPKKRIVKRVHKWKPMLTSPLGRRRNRWKKYIITDMMKLKINNWTSYIQGRNKWKLYVEKAKRFKEWSCSAWRKSAFVQQQFLHKRVSMLLLYVHCLSCS
jgi:hypothetical protein